MTGSLIIRGGHVVTAADTFRADVLIADGKIVALGTDDGWTADRVIDAEGHYILPGGIDTHTHTFRAPQPQGHHPNRGRLQDRQRRVGGRRNHDVR